MQPHPSARFQSSPSGFDGLRGSLLLLLKKSQGLTAKELSTQSGASLNAVRHHLKELEAERLISYQRRHAGVGAPSFAYGLTPAGQALFPRRYEEILTGILEQLVENQGRHAVVSVLEARYATATERLQRSLAGLEVSEKMAALASSLSAEGYMAEASLTPEGGTLIQHNCAIQSLAEQFPEICAAEAKLLTAVLGGDVHRERHILAGCNACEYRVRFKPATADQPAQENI
jgi:DeoR family transcriptional regulator, suf operon transcriptional repressor